jgi:hypothetical protein
MHNRNHSLLHLLICSLLIITVSQAAEPKIQTWTSAAGVSVEAAYIGLNDGKAVFQRADGSKIEIDIAQLAKTDQQRVLQLAKKAGHISDEGTGATEQASPDKLTVFSDGKWKGSHTVYRGKTYHAWIDERCALYIQPREDGQDVGPSLVQWFRVAYVDTSKPKGRGQHVSRPIESYTSTPEPGKLQGRRDQVVFKGKCVDGVEFVRTITFQPEQIVTHLEMDEPASIKYPSYYTFAVRINQSVGAKAYESLEELKEITDGWTMTMLSEVDGRETYPFWKSMKSIRQITYAEANGPWGKREVKFKLPPEKTRDKTPLCSYFYVYSGNAMINGCSFRRHLRIEQADEVEYTIQIQ